MGYDEALAERIRAVIGDRPDVSEKRMFGGLAFLINGNMAAAASGEGGLLLRTDPDSTRELLTHPHARPCVMRGRAMQGWIRVEDAGVTTLAEAKPWISIGVAYAESLPPK